MTAILIFISVILSLVARASSQQQLSCRMTVDVTLHCDLTGFSSSFYELIALQIMKRDVGNGGEGVLASVDASGNGFSASDYLNARTNYDIFGRLERTGLGSMLRLTLADFTHDESGAYYCTVHYWAHADDPAVSKWSSGDLYVNGSVKRKNEIGTPGFAAKFVQGVQMTCTSFSGEDISAVSIAMPDTDFELFASWDTRDNKSRSSPGLWVSSHESSSSGLALEAHLSEVTYEDYQCKLVCRFETPTGSVSTSLHLEDCQGSDSGSNSSTAKSNCIFFSMDIDAFCSDTIIVAVIGLILILAAVIAVITTFLNLRRRKSKTHNDKNSSLLSVQSPKDEEEKDNDKNSSLLSVQSPKDEKEKYNDKNLSLGIVRIEQDIDIQKTDDHDPVKTEKQHFYEKMALVPPTATGGKTDYEIFPVPVCSDFPHLTREV